MSDINTIADLLAKRFIQRRDVKAIQKNDIYMPVTANGRPDGERLPWSRKDLEDHIVGRRSYGHYLVDLDGKCKLFAFDIDLAKPDPRLPRTFKWVGTDEHGNYIDMEPKQLDPRTAWHHPKAPVELRRFLTAQLRETASLLARIVLDTLGIPVAVSYSGNKGVHVYGFTGPEDASDVRSAGLEVIKYSGVFEPLRGKNFFKHMNDDPYTGLGCVDVEVFPKQDNLDGKDLGNLMRLPLGVNNKSKQQSHFVTLSSHVDELVPMDPVVAMEAGDPWLSH